MNRSLRIKTSLGYIEVFIPEGLRYPNTDSIEYTEFKEKLLKLIGADK